MQRLVLRIVVWVVLLAVLGCRESGKPPEAVPQATADQVIAPDPVGKGDPQDGVVVPVQSAASETPSIRFEQTEFDFGEAQAGKDLEHVFPFRNAGNATLMINKVGSA
jgi:hypothetical protein